MPRSHRHGGGAHLKAYDAVVPRGGGLSIGLSAGVSPFIAPPQRTCHQHDPRPAAARGAAGHAAAVNTSTPPASHHADSPHQGCTTRGRACRQRERPIAGYARHRASSRQRRRGTSADDRCVSRRLARAGRPTRAAQRRSRRCDAPLLSCFSRGVGIPYSGVEFLVPPTPGNLPGAFLYLGIFRANGGRHARATAGGAAAMVSSPPAGPGQPTIEGPGHQGPPGRRGLLSQNSRHGCR